MILKIKAVPRARRTEWAGEMVDGSRKVRLAAAPEDGKANAELCRFLAHEYGVPLASVTILSGAASTRKMVKIETTSQTAGS